DSTHVLRRVQPTALTYSVTPSGGHRDLHSFPTRRSSDLPDLRASDPAGRPRLQPPCATSPAGNPCRIHERGATPVEAAPVSGCRSEEHTLNSSHVKTSYAVFCLKKKMQHSGYAPVELAG